MNIKIIHIIQQLFIFTILIMFTVSGIAAPLEIKGTQGVVACGGDHNVDDKGTKANVTRWIIRNFNETDNIRLTRIRVFFAGGGPFDSDVDNYPPAWAALLGSETGESTLIAHGTIRLRSEDIVPFVLSQVELPYYGSLMHMIIEWEADDEVVPPDVIVVIPTFRKQDLVAKHAVSCLLTELE